jgi:hypothetical protein
MPQRSIRSIIKATPTLEGEGFVVHRPFPTAALEQFDPFLLLDRMGPVTVRAGEAKGAPDHPHRGFETVTYVLEGAIEHKDSRGNRGFIRSGDVQWMTAGAGVVHSEMPSTEIQQSGGRMDGFQLWVNLPRRDKMMKPRYQELASASIPTVSKDGVTVRTIAGESALVETRTPIIYLHVKLDPGAKFEQPVPEDFNVFAYSLAEDQAILFNRDGDRVVLRGGDDARSEFLLIGGRPINEPIARYGPFVMNSEAEIIQAIRDYQNGRMGEIDF